MEAKDTVKQIALDVFGTNDGLRPIFPHTAEKIQEAMEASFKAGKKEGIWLYAWWKDGVQYVGTTGRTLAEALKEVDDGG